MAKKKSIIPVESIERRILLIRGQKVILDADLAALYGVQTKVLNQVVKRYRQRFPEDFMFRLTKPEKHEVVTNCDHLEKLKYSLNLPRAFTEHGAIMAASVLKSDSAAEVRIYVVRTFVKLRRMLASHKTLAQKLAALERTLATHDHRIKSLIDAIRQLMEPLPSPRKRQRIGYLSELDKAGRPKQMRGTLNLWDKHSSKKLLSASLWG